MKLNQAHAEIFIPDNLPVEEALARTTHLCIAAHQDDIEMMAAWPVLECFQQTDKWFTGLVVTDGRGSPRNGRYAPYNDEEMRQVRFKEQRKAAFVGEYAALVMLDYPSQTVKDAGDSAPVKDILSVLSATQPQMVFTHNLADWHDTHVAVALRTITALRSLSEGERPHKLYGGEVWRGLDWMAEADKTVFDLSKQDNLQSALLGVFDSQISGGKRYDLASLARRRTHATLSDSHSVDIFTGLSLGMDMTLLLSNPDKSPSDFVQELILHFAQEVNERMQKMS